MKKIKEIANVRIGVYMKPTEVADVYYLQVSDFDLQGDLVGELKPMISSHDNLYNKVLANDDLLFAAKGSRNFCYHHINYNDYYYVASSSFLVINNICKDMVLPEYLNWYLNRTDVLNELKSSAMGTSIVSITKPTLENFEICLPSLIKQKQIVYLSNLQKRQCQLYLKISDLKKCLIDQKIKQFLV